MSRRRPAAPFSLFSFQDVITAVTGIIILIALLLTLELLQRPPVAPVPNAGVFAEELRESLASLRAERDHLADMVAAAAQASERVAAASPIAMAIDAEAVEAEVERLDRDLQRLEQLLRDLVQREQELAAKALERGSDRDVIAELSREENESKTKVESLRRGNRIVFNRPRDASRAAWLVEVSASRLATAPVGETRPPVEFRGNAQQLAEQFLAWAGQRDPEREYFVLLVRPDGIELFERIEPMLRRRGFRIGFDPLGADQVVLDPEAGAGI
jgi:hypothetical protein